MPEKSIVIASTPERPNGGNRQRRAGRRAVKSGEEKSSAAVPSHTLTERRAPVRRAAVFVWTWLRARTRARPRGGRRRVAASGPCGGVYRSLQAATIPARANGSRRTVGPPSFATALATAGASGGTPGSPTPVGAAVLGTM